MLIDVKRKMTALEYEKLPEGPPQQLIDGDIIMTPSPTRLHQHLVIKLAAILESFSVTHNLGNVYTAPLDVFFTHEDVYQPDIIFISKGRKEIEKEKIIGAPDLVVEVLSPSTAYYDLTHKKNIYEETGVKEFWVVDPEGKTVEIYENINSAFVPFSRARVSGTVNSKRLQGLQVEIDKLFVAV